MSRRQAARTRAAAEAEKLAVENRLMEQRLRELKLSLKKDRENREARGGYTWRSGKAGKGGARQFADDVLKQNAQRRARGGRMKYDVFFSFTLGFSQSFTFNLAC